MDEHLKSDAYRKWVERALIPSRHMPAERQHTLEQLKAALDAEDWDEVERLNERLSNG